MAFKSNKSNRDSMMGKSGINSRDSLMSKIKIENVDMNPTS